jgi:hypothetical protein
MITRSIDGQSAILAGLETGPSGQGLGLGWGGGARSPHQLHHAGGTTVQLSKKAAHGARGEVGHDPRPGDFKTSAAENDFTRAFDVK